ncbi:ADP-ribosylglycohydrolase family protein [Salinibacterium amurskyense]|uniref:ADP-ribosylglycohydrolase family protein n=1 Tax=Salinibacterium amurskyense TaxID=205941 RepID=UPI0031204C44
MTDITYDRILGSFYAVALGDAMGMPSELWPRARVLNHFGRISEFLPGPDGHFVVDGYVAGQVTDDTQQTIMLAGAIIDGGGKVDAITVARHIVAWADRVGASEGNFLGPSSAKAIAALRDGASPWDTGKTGETNGAAMRIAPIGLLSSPENLKHLVDNVEAACVASHHTDVAISGAALIAGAVSAAVELPKGAKAADHIDDVLEVGYAAASLAMQRGEHVVAASVVARSKLAVSLARTISDETEFLQALYDTVGASVLTTESVPAAVGLMTRAEGDPLRCALLAANLGGDTDTIGAIAGGMCGALSTVTGIPAEFRDKLNDVNELGFEELAAKLRELRSA